MEIDLYDRRQMTEREVKAGEGGLNASANNFPCLLLMASLLKMTLPQFHQVTVSRAVYHMCVCIFVPAFHCVGYSVCVCVCACSPSFCARG